MMTASFNNSQNGFLPFIFYTEIADGSRAVIDSTVTEYFESYHYLIANFEVAG